MSSAWVFVCLFAYASAQCTWPTIFTSPSKSLRLNDGAIEFNTTTSGAGNINLAGVGPTAFTCAGNTGIDFFGKVTVSGIGIGMCFTLEPIAGVSSHLRFAYRTNLTTSFGYTVNARVAFFGAATFAALCTSGGNRPEYEHLFIDPSLTSLTPITCPSALQQNFTTYQVDPLGTPSCAGANDKADGLSSSTSINFNTGSCAGASNVIGSGMLHCLSTMTLNGHSFVWFSDQLATSGATYYCASWTSSGSVSMSVVKGVCEATQNPSLAGTSSAMNGTVFLMTPAASITTAPPTGLPGGSGGSGAGLLAPSFFLIAASAIYKLFY